jgi:hypothetical protein
MQPSRLAFHSADLLFDGDEIKPWEDEGDEVKSALDAMIARRESRIKSHRTRGGMAVSAAAGKANGGPRRFGFEKFAKGQKDGILTPIPAEVAVVELMFEMAREGKTQVQIARELNALRHRTASGHPWRPRVSRVLGNPIWIGKLVNAQGEHDVMEPLIDPELWHAVQRGLCKDGKRRGRHSAHFLLAGGLLRCGSCGSAMAVRRADTPAGMRVTTGAWVGARVRPSAGSRTFREPPSTPR